MVKIRIFFLLLIVSGWAAGCQQRQAPPNIIFLIGDGMGLSQVSAGYYYGEGESHFSRFRDIGLMKTSSGSHKITDSAAGATAFSCGIKTYNGAIGVDMDKKPVPTLLEELEENGWNTGLIATSSITHATPASFYAHVEQRGLQEDIAAQLAASGVDFFAGGGTKFFFQHSKGSAVREEVQRNFRLDTADITTPITDFSRRYGYLMAPDGLTPKHQGRGDFLAQATARAFEYLGGQEAPFFLMIEGSQIDWGGHANDADYLIQEQLEFDAVVGQALDFAEQNDNTLVLVTADHETGGFTLASEVVQDTATGTTSTDYNRIAPTFSTGGHSTTLIPVFARGKSSQKFTGVYENTAIHTYLRQVAHLANH
ncbi:MAG: alkaline phosphatase [Bacteroidota bacterium]